MPDNGFGTKENSEDFLLRIYLIKPRWTEASGGPGSIKIRRFISLRDPDRKINFPIINEDTKERLLTGADFDIESLQRAKDGTFWIGEEFGPFLLHVSRTGRVLSAPISFPQGKSPQHPELGSETANVPRSGGFEAMAASPKGRYLYPILEKALADDPDPRRRVIAQFDSRYGEYTGRTWSYRVDTDANLVADAQMLRGGNLLILERDDYDGEAAVTKRVYRVDLDRTEGSGQLSKKLLVDLLKIDNPYGLGTSAAWGTGNPFSFGLVSVETLVPLAGGDLMIANDNNYPGNAARVPGIPDDTEMIILDPYARSAEPGHEAEVIAHRGASGYRPWPRTRWPSGSAPT
jgi:glycerophosphoryl diester phosphodiesterase